MTSRVFLDCGVLAPLVVNSLMAKLAEAALGLETMLEIEKRTVER